jgi:hypothetical protein
MTENASNSPQPLAEIIVKQQFVIGATGDD